MTSEELLDIIKLIKGVKTIAHDMTLAAERRATSWELQHKGGKVLIRGVDEFIKSEYTEERFLTQYKDVPWQVKLPVSNLLRLVQRSSVHMVEAVLSGNGFRSTHRLYMDNGWLYDTGCDDEERKITPTGFQEEYNRTWWTIDQVLTEKGQMA